MIQEANSSKSELYSSFCSPLNPIALSKEKSSPKSPKDLDQHTGNNMRITFMTSKDVKITPKVYEVDNTGTPDLSTLCKED